eukprot:5933082-Pyramimonas_sp.AAC.1
MFLDKSRKAEPASPLRADEIKSYRSMVAQIQWVARESRPDVAGGASLQAAALPSPSVEDALLCIKICRHLKATAAQRISIWPVDIGTMTMITVSDAGGPGTARRGGAQGAWMVMAAEGGIKNNRRVK